MELLIDRIRPVPGRQLLRVEEVASVLDVNENAVNTLVDMKLLPCVNVSPRFERRFREDDVRFLILK